MKKTVFISALVALVVSSAAIFGYSKYFGQKTVRIEHLSDSPSKKVLYERTEGGGYMPVDFTRTATAVTAAVVHIRSTQNVVAGRNSRRGQSEDFFNDPFFRRFFGPQDQQEMDRYHGKPQPRVGTGSGVVIESNGYIVTNNHVIENADLIEVTLHDNRTVEAELIGTDPTTDLALLKINEENLVTIPFINSDDIQVGEWVLAVGNPFNLNSTVTAGIVSAKGRNINILHEQYAIESFIQTDAAINPGNSGGALVNLEGGLVGINSAIASPTGSYAGYGFAIPANIVSKVVADLIKYGGVQRGYLGIMIRSIDADLAKEKGLSRSEGVYVDSLMEKSGAKAAGMRIGDVIIAIDGKEIKTTPELQEIIAGHHPGDEIEVTVDRNDKIVNLTVQLNNREGNTDIITKKPENKVLDILGADFETVDEAVAKKMNIEGGVRVTGIRSGKIRRFTDIQEGFIITKVDDRIVTDVKSLLKILKKKKGGVLLTGIYEGSSKEYYYAFGMDS